MTQDELDTLIDSAAGKAQRVKADDLETERHRLSELVEFAKFQAGQRASKRALGGIQFVSLKPCGGGGN